MDQSQQRIQMLDMRVEANALVYARGNWFESMEYTGTGEYTITLSADVDYSELNIRCILFGNPVASD